MNEFLAETIGTAILIILGDGVVAGVLLARSKAQNAGWIVITFGWGLAVAIAVYMIGKHQRRAHQPGGHPGRRWSTDPEFGIDNALLYWAGQFLGAFIGAVIVWLHYLPHWAETEDPGLKLAVFSTGPAIRNTTSNLISEIIGTFVLVFAVFAIGGPIGSDHAARRRLPGRRHRPLARRPDRLRDQPGPRSRTPHRACGAPDRRQGRVGLELFVDPGGRAPDRRRAGRACLPGAVHELADGHSAMKKLINAPDAVVDEALAGMVAAHGDLLRSSSRTSSFGPMRRARARSGSSPAVARATSRCTAGSSGAGMLDAACPGAVFTSPVPDQMLAATKAVDGGAGVLHIVKNYTGDIMNFELAAELAQGEGIEVTSVVIADDVAVQDSLYTAGRRGVGGTVLAEKIVGAAAEEGQDLAAVTALCQRVQDNVRSMGMALTSCTVPAAGKPTFEIGDDEMEIGVGIHGEPGRERRKLASADEITEALLTPILDDGAFGSGDRVLAFVNGMGGTPLHRAVRRLQQGRGDVRATAA